jgi:NAD(P)H-hydrate epimerase
MPAQLLLSREQVRRVDQIAIEQFKMPGIVLMENAARGVLDAILRWNLPHDSALILCGGGNNGGDGLAIARHLTNRGCNVTIGLCTDPQKYAGDALINWQIAQAMKLPTFDVTPDAFADHLRRNPPQLIIDAIFGTGLSQPPRDPFPQLATTINAAKIAVVAIDLPSGLDCDTGRPLGLEAIRATLTVTFVARKKGFAASGSDQFTGDVEVADIGCPREAIELAMREN